MVDGGCRMRRVWSPDLIYTSQKKSFSDSPEIEGGSQSDTNMVDSGMMGP